MLGLFQAKAKLPALGLRHETKAENGLPSKHYRIPIPRPGELKLRGLVVISIRHRDRSQSEAFYPI
jgi:hypothetical protein